MGFDVVFEVAKGKTASAKIREGKVVMRLPASLVGKERERVILRFERWAKRRLSNVNFDSFCLPEYKHGGRVVTHNKVYDLVVLGRRGKRSSVYLDGGVIEVAVSEGGDLRSLVEKVIMRDQLPYLKEVIAELNALYFQRDYGEVRFRRVKSRFGSCSNKGNITIAYALLFAPREVFRYVCVHELAHLVEFNHSQRFWDLVKAAMPDYENCERWLKENGVFIS